MFYDSYRKEQTILSLGLNPSLTRKFEKKLAAIGLELEPFERASLAEQKIKIVEAIKYQNELKYSDDSIQYFKLLKRFFKEVDVDFEKTVFHYDLYQNRETNSKEGQESYSRTNKSVERSNSNSESEVNTRF